MPALLLLPLVLLTACGGAEEEPDQGAAAGSCLTGAEDCDDVPTGSGGVESQPDGSLAVADVVATPVDGSFRMSGYWLAAGDGARLCEALAESYPPQCGGASMPVELDSAQTPAGLRSEGEVQWSEEPVSVDGQVVDGVFVAPSR